MDKTPKQEALNLIEKHDKVLILPGRPDGDSIGSALALKLALSKLDKEADVLTTEDIPEEYDFLPGVDEIETELEGMRDFVISVDSSTAKPQKLSHQYKDGKLEIFITPKEGEFTPEMVTFEEGGLDYDLIITTDAADLEMLGGIYEDHPELFREIPVVNIDHHASNDFYGTVNLVDVTASSACEVLVGLFEAMSEKNELIDEDASTCLLTGVLSDTGSFQHSNTTPKSLTVGAQLIAAGADHQTVIKKLFKTYPLSLLHLWSRALERVRFNGGLGFAWSYLTYQDYEETQADSSKGLINKLLSGIPGAEIVVLLKEQEPNMIKGSIRTDKGVDASKLAEKLGGGGHPQAAGFKIEETTMEDAMDLVFEKVRNLRQPENADQESESDEGDELVKGENIELQ